MLEDQELPLCRLEEDLIWVVALDGSSNWLASRHEADNDFFALELGDKLRWALLCRGHFFGSSLSSVDVTGGTTPLGCRPSHLDGVVSYLLADFLIQAPDPIS